MSALSRDLRLTLIRGFSSPPRVRQLLRFGPAGLRTLWGFLTRTIPIASRELASIRVAALRVPDAGLREEALASIDKKAFHVQGGSILGTFLPPEAARRYIAIVAPLETIYDYLDNICDRLGGVPPAAYATLHEALIDALAPDQPLRDYFRDGPARDDGGYLRGLVETVRSGVRELPNWAAVATLAAESARFYSELQTFKHFPPDQRIPMCRTWYARHHARFPDLHWWEFAAACGSSMPVFAMLYLAAQEQLDLAEIRPTFDAYFPHVSAVHILLDYYIDQAEDREHRELNFVACYPTSAEAVARMQELIRRTSASLQTLAFPQRHDFVLRAMCLFYLSHPKVFEQKLGAESASLLAALS